MNTYYTAIVTESDTLAASLEPANVAVLNELVRRTGAVIVISSAWRRTHSLAELCEGFAIAGCVVTIHDTTPSLEGHSRGHEIQAWIVAQPEPPTRYVILDDEHDMPEHPGKLIKTNPVDGLCKRHLRRALGLLAD
jgi:hypothetical protein